MTRTQLEQAMAQAKRQMEEAEEAIIGAECIRAQFDAEDAYDLAQNKFVRLRAQLAKIMEVSAK